jgi:hypothetical protein
MLKLWKAFTGSCLMKPYKGPKFLITYQWFTGSSGFSHFFKSLSPKFIPSIPLEMASMSSSLLIQISSLRRNNNLDYLTSFRPHIRVSSNRYLPVSRLLAWNMKCLVAHRYPRPTHQTRKPFYITPFRQKKTTPPSCIK